MKTWYVWAVIALVLMAFLGFKRYKVKRNHVYRVWRKSFFKLLAVFGGFILLVGISLESSTDIGAFMARTFSEASELLTWITMVLASIAYGFLLYLVAHIASKKRKRYLFRQLQKNPRA